MSVVVIDEIHEHSDRVLVFVLTHAQAKKVIEDAERLARALEAECD